MPPCAATGHRWQFWAQLPNGGILWVCGDCGAERECGNDNCELYFSHACYLCRQTIPDPLVGCIPCSEMVARSSRINNAEKDLDKAVRALLSISGKQATMDVLLFTLQAINNGDYDDA